MTSKLIRTITFVFFGIFGACFLAMFVLDAKYSSNPSTPDAHIGRIYEITIKYHGHAYLTDAEYAPYRWLTGLMVVCGAVIVLVNAIDFLKKQVQRRRGP
jgi:hypothetical protein